MNQFCFSNKFNVSPENIQQFMSLPKETKQHSEMKVSDKTKVQRQDQHWSDQIQEDNRSALAGKGKSLNISFIAFLLPAVLWTLPEELEGQKV
jgi:hypothetical protein